MASMRLTITMPCWRLSPLGEACFHSKCPPARKSPHKGCLVYSVPGVQRSTMTSMTPYWRQVGMRLLLAPHCQSAVCSGLRVAQQAVHRSMKAESYPYPWSSGMSISIHFTCRMRKQGRDCNGMVRGSEHESPHRVLCWAQASEGEEGG